MSKRFLLVLVSLVCVFALPAASMAQTYNLSGTIRDSGSITVQGLNVKAVNQSSYDEFDSVTNASGQYNFIALDQEFYDLWLQRSGSAVLLNIAAPTSFNYQGANDFALTTNDTKDMSLPAFATVTGSAMDGTTGVADVKIEASDVSTGFDCYGKEWTNGSANYSMLLIPGTYNFTATFPDTSVVNQNGVAVANGTVVNFQKGTVPSFRGQQALSFSPTGAYMYLYNYMTGYQEWSAGGLTMNYTLPDTQWIGAFLYDNNTSTWDAVYYIYGESLY